MSTTEPNKTEASALPQATPTPTNEENETEKNVSTLSAIDSEQELHIKAAAAHRLKMLGVTEEEMKRWNALKRLGLRNEDFDIGCELMASSHPPEHTKEEQLTGYTMAQIKASKAVNVLGTTEEDIDDERAKKLSSLGVHDEAHTHTH
jgi:hypothetical protein